MPSSRTRSASLYDRAARVIPGGVNSPVRAFQAVGGEPLFIRDGDGAEIVDADGNSYIDYVGSWGPLILGHRPPVVVEALRGVLERGTSFGAPTDIEVEMAELICEIVPSVEMVRMVNSGTEACMTALRLARGVTGRDHVIKFNGCYHGHSDGLLVEAGSGVATFGISGSPGVPGDVARCTASIEFNDLDLLRRTVDGIGPGKVAAVILEPVPGNMGLVPPEEGFLQGVRDLCTEHGILLIFDEVMTGFRVALGGAQERFGITPDLSTYSKVIGGGLPVGAFGGRAELMSQLAPAGPVYQAGTLSGNPLAMTAGLATLRHLRDTDPYDRLEALGRRWVEGMRSAADEAGVPATVAHCGSMVGLFFHPGPVRCYAEARQTDTDDVPALLPGHARRGHLPRPLRLRGRLPVDAAHRGDGGPHRRGRGPGPRAHLVMNTAEAERRIRHDGFTLLPGVIPAGEVAAIRDAVVEAQGRRRAESEAMLAAIRAKGHRVSVTGVDSLRGVINETQGFAPYLATSASWRSAGPSSASTSASPPPTASSTARGAAAATGTPTGPTTRRTPATSRRPTPTPCCTCPRSGCSPTSRPRTGAPCWCPAATASGPTPRRGLCPASTATPRTRRRPTPWGPPAPSSSTTAACGTPCRRTAPTRTAWPWSCATPRGGSTSSRRGKGGPSTRPWWWRRTARTTPPPRSGPRSGRNCPRR